VYPVIQRPFLVTAPRLIKLDKVVNDQLLAWKKKTCCNTCDSLREYWNDRVDAAAYQNIISQSLQCGGDKPRLEKEGCRTWGFFAVEKTKGSFHIATGTGVQQKHSGHQHHVHALTLGDLINFNISHKISVLMFGDHLPGMKYPLHEIEHHELALIAKKTYFLHVVPVHYWHKDQDKPQKSNQLSFTEQHFSFGPDLSQISLPGVFFKYDISPFKIELRDVYTPFSHLISRICGIVIAVKGLILILVRLKR